MKTISILLALIVVLGFVSEAGAFERMPSYEYTARIFGCRFGLVEYDFQSSPNGYDLDFPTNATYVLLGSRGYYQVPFTATQGFVGFCMIAFGLVALVMMLTFRWKRKAAHCL